MEVNAAICYECNTIIQSRTRHDFVQCYCPKDETGQGTGIFVDGGLECQRFGWGHDNYRTFTTLAALNEAIEDLYNTNQGETNA